MKQETERVYEMIKVYRICLSDIMFYYENKVINDDDINRKYATIVFLHHSSVNVPDDDGEVIAYLDQRFTPIKPLEKKEDWKN